MRVIVTGAAGGIGRAIVDRCVHDGHVVVAVDIDSERLKPMADDQVLTSVVDLRASAAIDAFFAQLQSDQLDVHAIVNNAGIYLARSLDDYSPEEILDVFQTNVIAAGVLTQGFARNCQAKGIKGRVVNISSVVAHDGSADVFYAASKAALIGLTKATARVLAPKICVNAIAPGLVETDMVKLVPSDRIRAHREKELLKDHLTPADVAATVSFLLSEEASHYTGAVFDLNNGEYLR